jgi:hypothetical protein
MLIYGLAVGLDETLSGMCQFNIKRQLGRYVADPMISFLLRAKLTHLSNIWHAALISFDSTAAPSIIRGETHSAISTWLLETVISLDNQVITYLAVAESFALTSPGLKIARKHDS